MRSKYKPKGQGRACIHGNHLAGVLAGGSRPAHMNPKFEVEQKPPTPSDPVRQSYKFATSGLGKIPKWD